MSLEASSLPENLPDQVVDAIRQVRSEIQWRPGKDKAHLAKRIERGHLPPKTSLSEYYAIIRLVLTHPEAIVYVFQFGETFYPTVVAPHENQIWLVMFGMDGTMETAFPPAKLDTYFNSPKYHWTRKCSRDCDMNTLLESYLVDVKHPDVSGIEHLQMLETRSELAKVEQQLTAKERQALAEADRRLATDAARFLAELSRFVNLAEERRQRQPEPDEWWWYLDILIQAPALPKRPYQPGIIPA